MSLLLLLLTPGATPGANVAAADFKGVQGQLAVLQSQWRGAVWNGAVHAPAPPADAVPTPRLAAAPQHFDLTVQGRIFRVNVAALEPPPLRRALFAGPQQADLTLPGAVHGQPPPTAVLAAHPPARVTGAPQAVDLTVQGKVFRSGFPDTPAGPSVFQFGTHELAVRDGQFRGWVRGQTPPSTAPESAIVRPIAGGPQQVDLTVQGRVRMAIRAAQIPPPLRPALFAGPQPLDLTTQGFVRAGLPVQAPGLRGAFLARPQAYDLTVQGRRWGPQPPAAAIQDPAPVSFVRGGPQQADLTLQGRLFRQPPPSTDPTTFARLDFKAAQGQLTVLDGQFRGMRWSGPVHFPVPAVVAPPQRPWASRNQESPEQRPSRVWAQVPPNTDPATLGAIIKIDYAAKQGQLQVMDSQFRGAMWRAAVHLPQFVAPGSPRGARRDLYASPQLAFYDRNPTRVYGPTPPSTAPVPPPNRPSVFQRPQDFPAQRGSRVYGPMPPDPINDEPVSGAEYQFGSHALTVLDGQWRGKVWGQVPPSFDPPPPLRAFQLALPQVLPEQPMPRVRGPMPPTAARNPPPLRGAAIAMPQASPEQQPGRVWGAPPPPPPVPVILPRTFVSRIPQSPEQTYSRITGSWAQVLPIVLVQDPFPAASYQFGTHQTYVHSLQTGGLVWKPFQDPPFLIWKMLAARDELENVQGGIWARAATIPSTPPQPSTRSLVFGLANQSPELRPSWVRGAPPPTAERPPSRPWRGAPQESPEQPPSFIRGLPPPDVDRVAPPEGVFRFLMPQEGYQWNPSRIRAVWIPPPPLGFNPGPALAAGMRQEAGQQQVQPRLERLSAEFMPTPPTPSPYIGTHRWVIPITPRYTVAVLDRYSVQVFARYALRVLSRR